MYRMLFAVLLSLLPALVCGQELPPPLVFHAAFDGTTDAVSKGDGKAVSIEGPVAYRPGKVGQALRCGEGGAAVTYQSAGHIRPAAGSMEMWVCPLDWTGHEDEFHVFLEALNPGWLLLYRYYQGGILTLLGTSGNQYRSAGSPPIDWKPGEWHHLVGTWRARQLEIYVDGQRAGFSDNPLLPEQFADTFVVGDRPWHVARQRQSLVDEVKLYSAPLDAESIAKAAEGEAFTFTPRLLISTTADADAGELHVMCDAAGMVGETGRGRTATVELTPKGKPDVLARGQIETLPNDVGRCDLPLARIAQGEYEVHASLLDADGNQVASAVGAFAKPGPPVWRGNVLGMADRVLAPWTPLKTDRQKVAVDCWDRRYEFGALLSQVRSGNTPLLSSPVTLEAIVGGKTVALAGACAVKSAGSTRAVFTGSAMGAGLQAQVQHETEFDGYTWTQVRLQAARPVPVEELRLTWTMPRVQASLLHCDGMSWISNYAGPVRPEGWSSDWAHFFWVGNEDRGLSWYAETNRNWIAAKGKPALEVKPQGDQVRCTVRLIAAPTTIDQPLDYSFGMMATPARPRPANARRWRMAPGVRPTIDIVWPNGNMKYYGYTEPEDPAKFAERAKTDHEQGTLIIPYINLNYVSGGVPEWSYYGPKWADPARVVTPSDVAAMGYASMGTCPASRDWQDFILYRINEMIDKYGVDGIYIDCWGPSPCSAEPCGWQDATGKLQPTRPIRAYREILRRVYALFRERRPNALLMIHMSSEVDIPMLSFADTILDGEQFVSSKLKDDYLELLPPEMFRAEFMGRNYGPVDFFLPEFRGDFANTGTPNLAAYLMLHDVNPWPIWSDAKAWNKLYEALDAVKIEQAKFVPYWQRPPLTGNQGVLASAYVQGDQVVLAVVNTGETPVGDLVLDPKPLGSASVGSAKDMLTDEQFQVGGNMVRAPLARHQGRVLLLHR